MANYHIAAVPMNLVNALWDKMKPLIDDVVKHSHNEATTETAYDQIMNGNLLPLIVCEDADVIALTLLEIRTFDTGEKALFVPVFGGKKLDEWAEQMQKVLIALAKDFGCTQLRGIGARKGWSRYLIKLGWEEYSVTVGCEVK